MPADWSYAGGQALSGAASGASIGSLFGPEGTAIGAGVGFLAGGIEGLFSDSPEQQREKRYRDLLASIEKYRLSSLQQGQTLIGQQSADEIAMARQAAGRRAAASGRIADTAAYAAPEVGRLQDIASRRLNEYTLGVNQQAGQAQINAAMEYSQRPIEPSIGDYLMGAGEAASIYSTQRKQQQIQEGSLAAFNKYIDAMSGVNQNFGGAPGSAGASSPEAGPYQLPPSWLAEPQQRRRYSIGSLPPLSFGNY